MAQATGNPAIHINAGDAQPVVLHPSNDDLFVRTGKQVIEACQLGIGLELWLKELESAIEEVRAWCSTKSAVAACHVAIFRSRVNFFFIPQTTYYDFDLGLELSDLNVQLYQRYNVGMVEIHQLPEREMSRFIPSDSSRLIYVHQAATH